MHRIPGVLDRCRRFASGLLLAGLLAGSGAHAAVVDDLYEAQIPVVTQGDRERATALVEAFRAVLVKVTGSRDAATAAVFDAALAEPMTYVQQFLYRPLPPDAAEAGGGAGAPTQLMLVRFDPQGINRLVERAGAPLWGRDRPATLVWIAVEDRGERYLAGTGGAEGLSPLLMRDAQRRGLPVLLPLLDLEDRAQVAFTDVWGNFQDVLLRASARYQVPAVMVGRLLRERDGGWSARWSLYQDGAGEHWAATAAELDAVVAGGVDGAADRLGARYASVSSGDGRLADIRIDHITGLADYARVARYLRGLEPVRELRVLGVEGDRVSFRARLGGDAETLARTIAFGNTLARVSDPALRGAAPLPGPPGVTSPVVEELSFRLLP